MLAGAATKTGKIGYVGGLSLPFSYSEVHAMEQALKDMGSTAKITPVWTGDFNDPAKAQQITTQLLDQGNDVIVGSLNLGMVGAFQAVKGKPAGVVITAKYTDKSQFDPAHYASSSIYDFTRPAGRHSHQDRRGRAQRLPPARVRHGRGHPGPEERRCRRHREGRAGGRGRQVRQGAGRQGPHAHQVTGRHAQP